MAEVEEVRSVRANQELAAFEMSLTPNIYEVAAIFEIDEILEWLLFVLKRSLQRIKRKIAYLKTEYEKLPVKHGSIEYKSVRNKAGKIYRYYYYRPPGKPRRSIYIGEWKAAQKILKSLEKAKELRKKISFLENRREDLERKIHYVEWLQCQVKKLKII